MGRSTEVFRQRDPMGNVYNVHLEEIRSPSDLPLGVGDSYRVVNTESDDLTSGEPLAYAMISNPQIVAFSREVELESVTQILNELEVRAARPQAMRLVYVAVPRQYRVCRVAPPPTGVSVFIVHDTPSELRSRLGGTTNRFGISSYRPIRGRLDLAFVGRPAPDCVSLLTELRVDRMRTQAQYEARETHRIEQNDSQLKERQISGRIRELAWAVGEILGDTHPLAQQLVRDDSMPAGRQLAAIQRRIQSLTPTGFIASLELMKHGPLTPPEVTNVRQHLAAIGQRMQPAYTSLTSADFALWSTLVAAHCLRDCGSIDRPSLELDLVSDALAGIRSGLTLAESLSLWRYSLLPESVWQTGNAVPWVLADDGNELGFRFATAVMATAGGIQTAGNGQHVFVRMMEGPEGPALRFAVMEHDGHYSSWLMPADAAAIPTIAARIRSGAIVLVHQSVPEELKSALAARADVSVHGLDAFVRKEQRSSLSVAPPPDAAAPTRVQLVPAQPGGVLRVAFLRLDSRGDSIVIENSDGSVFVVDAGLGRAATTRLIDHFGGNVPPLRFLFTHRDADHIGDVPHMLEDGRFRVLEALMGQTAAAPRKLAAETVCALTANGLTELPTQTRTVRHFIHKSLPKEAALLKTEAERVDDLNVWTLPLGGDTFAELYQYATPKAENQSGIVLKIRRKGRCILLTDDIDPVAMRALTAAHVRQGIDLTCGTVKWPHHVWFPRDRASDLNAVKSFVQAVAPHTIVFSNSGHASHSANVAQAKAFIKDDIGVDIQTFWTWQDNTIEIHAHERAVGFEDALLALRNQ
jgi:beta-lactamase superfamily II metal-dependent hydrolase